MLVLVVVVVGLAIAFGAITDCALGRLLVISGPSSADHQIEDEAARSGLGTGGRALNAGEISSCRGRDPPRVTSR